MKKNCKIVQLYDLRIDGLAPTMMSRLAPGIVTGSAAPTFSWKINCGIQRACRIIVASTPEQLQTAPDLWDSFWIRTRDSLAIRYEGKRLHSCNHLFFKVFVEMEDGETAESEIGEFTVGLLSSSDWTAKWITADGFEHIAPAPAPYFRRCFEVRLGMKQALLFSSARGLLELTLNGKRIDEHDFLPGWSHFPREIQYTAYDVTGFIRPG
ncbi:MAG: hypothetical protein GX904_02630, partial [Acholeplasmataceae bacterium]|nr:hypothetical protein [Acholeplasmataceae bacterium]